MQKAAFLHWPESEHTSAPARRDQSMAAASASRVVCAHTPACSCVCCCLCLRPSFVQAHRTVCTAAPTTTQQQPNLRKRKNMQDPFVGTHTLWRACAVCVLRPCRAVLFPHCVGR